MDMRADWLGPEPPPETEHADADSETAPLPLLLAAEIEPVLDAAELVQGLLGAGTAAILYGESNSGKTFLATDLALSIAAGRAWAGRRVERAGVIYCALEGGHSFRNRVVAWLRHHKIDPAGLPFVAIPSAINMLDPGADLAKLAKTIAIASARLGCAVGLIVIDTLSRALAGGDENSPEDMGSLVRNADWLRQATGAAVLFIHHSGKDLTRDARGHSLLRAAVDTEIEVADREGARVAVVTKQRDLPKGGEIGFKLVPVPLGHNRHGEEVTSCIVETMTAVGIAPRNRLPPQVRVILDKLHDLCAGGGELLPTGDGFPPPPARGVRHEVWRAAADSVLGHLGDQSRKRTFNRAVESLLARKIVGSWDGWVWAARPGQAG